MNVALRDSDIAKEGVGVAVRIFRYQEAPKCLLELDWEGTMDNGHQSSKVTEATIHP